MTCLTPSNPDSIPFGESLDISDSLAKTAHGSLFADGRSMTLDELLSPSSPPSTSPTVANEQHRVADTEFLLAQTEKSVMAIRKLWKDFRDRSKGKKSTVRPRATFDESECGMDEMREAMAHTQSSSPLSQHTPAPRPKAWNPLKLSKSSRIAIAASRKIRNKPLPPTKPLIVPLVSSPSLPVNPNADDEEYDIPDEFEEDFFSTASIPDVPDL